jgi:hypothetical protein
MPPLLLTVEMPLHQPTTQPLKKRLLKKQLLLNNVDFQRVTKSPVGHLTDGAFSILVSLTGAGFFRDGALTLSRRVLRGNTAGACNFWLDAFLGVGDSS